MQLPLCGRAPPALSINHKQQHPLQLTQFSQTGARLHPLVALRGRRSRGGPVGRPTLEVRVLDVANEVRLHKRVVRVGGGQGDAEGTLCYS